MVIKIQNIIKKGDYMNNLIKAIQELQHVVSEMELEEEVMVRLHAL